MVQPDRRSAGEGQSHKARAYVYEESHSGIVPMNHSNKDGKLSAESGEGRPLIKENAGQPNTYPTQSGKGVSQGLAGVPGNLDSLGVFRQRVIGRWWRSLRRRSQKRPIS
ncbi:MAG: hypothetical protein WCB11_28780 [Terriglobales bacterium]